jgi:hypothetical protein
MLSGWYADWYTGYAWSISAVPRTSVALCSASCAYTCRSASSTCRSLLTRASAFCLRSRFFRRFLSCPKFKYFSWHVMSIPTILSMPQRHPSYPESRPPSPESRGKIGFNTRNQKHQKHHQPHSHTLTQPKRRTHHHPRSALLTHKRSHKRQGLAQISTSSGCYHLNHCFVIRVFLCKKDNHVRIQFLSFPYLIAILCPPCDQRQLGLLW